MGLPTNESNASSQARPFEIVDPTPEQRKQVVDFVSKSLEERPAYRQFFDGHPGMMKDIVLLHLGSAYDESKPPNSQDKTNCEIWAIENDGKLQSVVTFKDPTKNYGANVREYLSRLIEQVSAADSPQWEHEHWHPAWKSLESKVDKETNKSAIKVMDLYTEAESRGSGFGTTLLDKVKSISSERNIEMETATDNERNLNFFNKRGLKQISQVDIELKAGTHQLTVLRLPNEAEST